MKFIGALILIAMLCGLPTACGFTPLYGKADNAAVAPQLSLVEIGAIKNESGQQLRNLLIDRLYPQGRARAENGVPVAARYSLAIVVSETRQGLAISQDATVTRQQLVDYADFTLVDKNSRATLLKRRVMVTSGYNVLGSQFSTLIAEQDVRGRNLTELADRMTTMLALYFSDPARAVPEPTDTILKPLFTTGSSLAPGVNTPGFNNSIAVSSP